MEKNNLCETCWKEPECFLKKGIFERQTCSEYEPMPLDDLLERDEFVRDIMVGACPNCGSENVCDCESYPLLELDDSTVGHCLDCETYWCLECGYVFERIEKGIECPHWAICAECSQEHGYLDVIEFTDRVCSTCERYDDCPLENLSECEKQSQYMCPYEPNISECPRLKGSLSKQS
jgi:hypothetical protein